jgi:hypothetical protein
MRPVQAAMWCRRAAARFVIFLSASPTRSDANSGVAVCPEFGAKPPSLGIACS